MKKVIVFDVDGTIANINHRRAFVQSRPKNWPAFNRGMVNDTVYEDILWLYSMFESRDDTIMLIASGRGSENRATTEKWLADNKITYEKLYMRPAKDSRQDYIIKQELLEQIRKDFGEPFLWFDDRQQVVDKIRSEGVRVLQVAPGNF